MDVKRLSSIALCKNGANAKQQTILGSYCMCHITNLCWKSGRERGRMQRVPHEFLIVICIPRDAGSDFGFLHVIQHSLWLGFLFFQQLLHGSEYEISVMDDVQGSPRSRVRQGIHVHHLMTGLAHGGQGVRTEQVDALFFVEETKRKFKLISSWLNESPSPQWFARVGSAAAVFCEPENLNFGRDV